MTFDGAGTAASGPTMVGDGELSLTLAESGVETGQGQFAEQWYVVAPAGVTLRDETPAQTASPKMHGMQINPEQRGGEPERPSPWNRGTADQSYDARASSGYVAGIGATASSQTLVPGDVVVKCLSKSDRTDRSCVVRWLVLYVVDTPPASGDVFLKSACGYPGRANTAGTRSGVRDPDAVLDAIEATNGGVLRPADVGPFGTTVPSAAEIDAHFYFSPVANTQVVNSRHTNGGYEHMTPTGLAFNGKVYGPHPAAFYAAAAIVLAFDYPRSKRREWLCKLAQQSIDYMEVLEGAGIHHFGAGGHGQHSAPLGQIYMMMFDRMADLDTLQETAGGCPLDQTHRFTQADADAGLFLPQSDPNAAPTVVRHMREFTIAEVDGDEVKIEGFGHSLAGSYVRRVGDGVRTLSVASVENDRDGSSNGDIAFSREILQENPFSVGDTVVAEPEVPPKAGDCIWGMARHHATALRFEPESAAITHDFNYAGINNFMPQVVAVRLLGLQHPVWERVEGWVKRATEGPARNDPTVFGWRPEDLYVLGDFDGHMVVPDLWHSFADDWFDEPVFRNVPAQSTFIIPPDVSLETGATLTEGGRALTMEAFYNPLMDYQNVTRNPIWVRGHEFEENINILPLKRNCDYGLSVASYANGSGMPSGLTPGCGHGFQHRLVSVDLEARSVKLWINHRFIAEKTLESAGAFGGRSVMFMKDDATGDVAYFRLWEEASPDGVVPSRPPDMELAGDAAKINAMRLKSNGAVLPGRGTPAAGR